MKIIVRCDGMVLSKLTTLNYTCGLESMWNWELVDFKRNEICRNPSFGLMTKAKGLQGCGPRERLKVTSHIPGNVGKCEGVNLHTPKATPILGDGIRWTLETSESNLKGQNPMACGVIYIIEKLLERRHLKWARITHLDI